MLVFGGTFQFDGDNHCCDAESVECNTTLAMPVFGGNEIAVEVDRCIANELKLLWHNGIKTNCSCCGHGVRENAFINVKEDFADDMLEMGYTMIPRGPASCGECDGSSGSGVFFAPKSVQEEWKP